MSKFKVGDIVVGNEKAKGFNDIRYLSDLVVLEVYTSSFLGQIVEMRSTEDEELHAVKGGKLICYYKYFELKEPTTPHAPTQTVEELVEECKGLQTQIESLEKRLTKKKAYLVSNRQAIDALVKPAYT